MPPRPFPHPFRVGIDICHIPRIYNIIVRETAKDPSQRPSSLFRLLNRLLTDREQKVFWRRWQGTQYIFGHGQERVENVAKFIAGRWAAKEAVIKAASRRLNFSDVMILSNKQRVPYGIILDQPAPRSRPQQAESIRNEHADQEQRNTDAYLQDDTLPSWMTDDDWEVGQTNLEAPRKDYWKPRLHASEAELDAEDVEGQVVRLSISHDGQYAAAVCLAPTEPQAGDVGGEAAARDPDGM